MRIHVLARESQADLSHVLKIIEDGDDGRGGLDMLKEEDVLRTIIERMQDNKTAVPIDSQVRLGGRRRDAYRGSSFVSFIESQLSLDEDDASKLCQLMIRSGFLECTTALDHTFTPEKLYVVKLDAPQCANDIKTWTRVPRHPLEASQDILSQIIDVFVLDAQGNVLGAARKLRRFELAVCELQMVDAGSLSGNQAIVFWLNVYHIVVMHTHIQGHRCSSWSRRRVFFKALKYLIAGYVFTLKEVEHGILRGNRAEPGFFSSQPFAAGDPRCKFVVDEVDPRVHFAFNCAVKSSPTLRVYFADSLDEDLHFATQVYLRRTVQVLEVDNIVSLPMQFFWYTKDFCESGSSGDLLSWVKPFLTPERASALSRLIGTPVKLTKREHDWDYHLSIESVVAHSLKNSASLGMIDGTDESGRLFVEILDRTHVSAARAREEADVEADRQLNRNRAVKESRAGLYQGHGGGRGNGADPSGRLVDLLGAEYDRIVKRYNLQHITVAIASIVLLVVELEIAWNPLRPCRDDPTAVCPGLERSTTTQMLKLGISVLTLIQIALLVSYYKFLKVLQIRRFGFRDTLDLTIPWRRLATEVFVCALHAPPYLDFDVTYISGRRGPLIDDKFGLMMLLRLYLVARVVRDHSTLYRQRKELVAAKGGQIEEVHLLSSFALTVKYLFQRQPGTLLTVIYLSALLLLSFAVFVGEREVQPDVFTYSTAIWFGITSITTVGYGDIVVRSFIGRTCAFILAVLGLVMSSMFFAAISQKLSPSMYQKYALKWLEDSRFEKVSRQVAASIIQLQWRYFKFQQVKHTMPTIARRRLESMFKLKSWLYSARFQKLRSDHKVGTKSEAFMDFTDILLLKRLSLVDQHLSHRFQWLDNRLHAMLMEMLRTSNSSDVHDAEAVRSRVRAASVARSRSNAGGGSGGGKGTAGAGGAGLSHGSHVVSSSAVAHEARSNPLGMATRSHSAVGVMAVKGPATASPSGPSGIQRNRGSVSISEPEAGMLGRSGSDRRGSSMLHPAGPVDAGNADDARSHGEGALDEDEEFERTLRFVASDASLDTSGSGSAPPPGDGGEHAHASRDAGGAAGGRHSGAGRAGSNSADILDRATKIRMTTALPKTDSAYELAPNTYKPKPPHSSSSSAGAGGGAGGAAAAASGLSTEPIAYFAGTLETILEEVRGLKKRLDRIEARVGNTDGNIVHNLPPLINKDL